jgi:serine/threonine protein kinase
VDIGCGTTVVGDSSADEDSSKAVYAHPLSMRLHSYQYNIGRANPNADPPDPGFYPISCPRFHRFKVIQPGNFTFDTCASMMDVGLSLYKRTDNLSESEPRMNITTGVFEEGKMFEVPLHDNNQQYCTVSTGLIRIQPDLYHSNFVDWMNEQSRFDPHYPPMNLDSRDAYTKNGCPLSANTHRTYFIGEVGDYFLASAGSSTANACSNFNIKMACSGGAESASPVDSDPLGFSVDVKTGAITGTPQKVRDGYKMRLRAVDAANKRTTIADWMFDVKEPPVFALNPTAGWSAETEGALASKFHVSETHLLPKPHVKTAELLQHPASGTFDQVVYLLSAEPDGHTPNCTGAGVTMNETQTISALTDVSTGAGAINIQCVGNYTAKLVARDGAGANVEVRSWRFEVLPRDTAVGAYGPNSMECTHGEAIDGKEEMDGAFTCNCDDTQYTGLNCQYSDITTCNSVGTVDMNGQCSCSAGFSGTNCQTDIDECAGQVCSNLGNCTDGLNEYTCECVAGFNGKNCEIEPDVSAKVDDSTVATPSYVAIGVVVFVLCVAVAYKVHSGKDRRHRIGLARKAAEPSYGASKAELTDALLAAVELGEYGLVPTLVELGADASARGASGQLPHASALKDHLQLTNPVHLAAIQSLFGAHCEFDAQIGACMRLDEEELVEHVLCEMAGSSWRSTITADTVAHKILEGCITGSLNEDQTVELMEAVLKRNKGLMTTTNARSKTPTELAIMCEGKHEIQTRFTVVLFERYQIARPQNPLYKSPTAEVHECVDLAELNNSEGAIGSNKRFVVKLMSNPDLWLRELKTRDALGEAVAGSYVGAVSAASTDTDNTNKSRAATAAAIAASHYAASASTQVRPITGFQTSFVEQTRRDEARHLMTEYPYAIQMPLADRNLNEIIASERLAEEPLDVIRQSSRKVLNLIQELHSAGVVHGDVKPKNVVRVDRTLMLIDLDMSIAVGSSEPVAHSNPEKFSGSTAYAAPELHKWMADREAGGFVDDGTSPLDKLATPQQIDLWSFAVTLYEMASGSPLFQNSYDRATPAALAKLKNWTGLDEEHVSQIESLHGAADSAAMRDVLLWALDADASNRPQSVAELTSHAFFDPKGGSMREHFVVNQIKQLLVAPPTNGGQRINVNVMVSYCWADTNFVLSKLTMELAPRVRELWLDRLGGEQGMGEFAKASMQRGVQNADVIIAVVSPAYIASINCGYEMALAHTLGKPVIPVVLDVPFSEWPPKQIGRSTMVSQFATEAGDLKIFVDMTDRALFFQKFQKELLPRLTRGFHSTVPHEYRMQLEMAIADGNLNAEETRMLSLTRQRLGITDDQHNFCMRDISENVAAPYKDVINEANNAAVASDSAPTAVVVSSVPKSRPKKGKPNKQLVLEDAPGTTVHGINQVSSSLLHETDL